LVRKVQSGIAPDFAEAGNIVGDNGATGKSGIERSHAKRLIAGSGGIDGGAAVKRAQLSFSLRSTDRDATLIGRDFHVGADRNAWQRHGLLGTHDAH